VGDDEEEPSEGGTVIFPCIRVCGGVCGVRDRVRAGHGHGSRKDFRGGVLEGLDGCGGFPSSSSSSPHVPPGSLCEVVVMKVVVIKWLCVRACQFTRSPSFLRGMKSLRVVDCV
jgi:hypothetical protein